MIALCGRPPLWMAPAAASQIARITPAGFVGNLVPVTILNISGGSAVAVTPQP